MTRLALILLLALPSLARAYPQFQLSTGTARCNACHYAPAGGGLINAYGRDEASEISVRGDGAFLHGLWEPPRWLALGADLRAAGIVNGVGATAPLEATAFPMQADLYANVIAGWFSANLIVGFRGSARPDEPELLSRLVSREHYLMVRPKPSGWYVRAGRFFPPYGLRLAEHPAYIRRYLDLNTLEEPYAVSGGWVTDRTELHLTAYTPDFLRPVGRRATGGALYFERRVGETMAFGGQARVSFTDDDQRHMLGGVAKYYWERARILFLGEVDFVHQSFDEADRMALQAAAYLGASWQLRRGLYLNAAYERFDQDINVPDVSRDALSLQAQWFPWAHFELNLFARGQVIGGGDGGDTSGEVMLQVHYYL